MTNNWQVFAFSGEAPEFSGAKALHASPKNPKTKPVPRVHPCTGTEHAIPHAGSIQRGVGMPCTDPGSQTPIPSLISDSPLEHRFTDTASLKSAGMPAGTCNVLHTQGEDHKLAFQSLSYCRTGNSRHSNLLAKPEGPCNQSGLNNLAKLSCQLRDCLPGAHCCDGSGLWQLGEMLGQPAGAEGCAAAAATALPGHPQKVPVTQTQWGSAPQTLGQTDHPTHGSLCARVQHHSLV